MKGVGTGGKGGVEGAGIEQGRDKHQEPPEGFRRLLGCRLIVLGVGIGYFSRIELSR